MNNPRHASPEDFDRFLSAALQARWPARRYGEARVAAVLAAVHAAGGTGARPAWPFPRALRALGFAAGLGLLVLAVVWLVTPGSPQPAGEAAPVEVDLDAPALFFQGGQRLDSVDVEWDGFGEAVDIRGDVLVVGASEWNQLGVGSAYVYRMIDGTWELETQLRAGEHRERQTHTEATAFRFGDAVALGKDLLAVGAPGVDDPVLGENSGAVYIFELGENGWTETARLAPGSAAEAGEPIGNWENIFGRLRPRAFGAVLALDGDLLAVGGDPDGRILVFERTGSGWAQTGQFHLPAVPGHDFYLSDMAVFGDTLVLSVFYAAPRPEFASVWKGQVAVYVYELSEGGWSETLRYRPEADAELLFLDGSRIGASVDVSGSGSRAELLAVGLPGFPDWSEVEENFGMFGTNPETIPDFPVSPRQAGQVFLFDRSEGGWTVTSALTPAGANPPPGPGKELSFDQPGLVFPGALFSEWPEVSFFGAAVDIDGDRLVVTSGFSNATYVFRAETGAWRLEFSLKPGNERGEIWEDYAQVVALSGLDLVLGTPGEFGNSAYVFRLCETDDSNCR